MSASSSDSGLKYLCLIRHGQGQHNPRNNPLALGFIPKMFKRDAKLTGKGRAQAAALQVPMHSLPFELILVSPLSRTIETATAAFAGHSTPKRLCHLMCERTTMRSDLGVKKSELLKKHPQLANKAEWQGFEEMPEEYWPPLMGPGKAAEQEVEGRVAEFKRYLLAQPELCFACVGHSAFFRTFTGMEEKLENAEPTWFILRSDGVVSPAPVLPPPPSAED